MRRIKFIASYPKSGNTWFRAFLKSAMQNGEAIDINDLDVPVLADRHIFRTLVGTNPSLFTARELTMMRANLGPYIENGAENILKVHDAFLRYRPEGLCPITDCSADVIYIVRDPRDVAISLAKHMNVSIDRAIEAMENKRFKLCNFVPPSPQLPQYLSSWSYHVLSWLEYSSFPLQLVRYEDMLHDAINVFSQAAAFLRLDVKNDAIIRAIEETEFEKLKSKEGERGFRERPPHCDAFFGSGKAQNWMKKLTDSQVNRIETAHKEVMVRLGYL